jgi:hypothetical protein
MGSADDPRDSITPGDKEWQEFRASLAAAMLLAWFLSEIDQIAPDYFTDLETRFQDGIGNADALARDDPGYDGAVPVQWPHGGVTFFDRAFFDELEDLLFPHGEAEGDFRFMALGLAVVGVQSALEVYAEARGVNLEGGATTAIRDYLHVVGAADLDADTADLLADCEATRHIFAHNRGLVDAKYIRRVTNCQLLEGTRRDVRLNTVIDFARAARRAAVRLRDTKGIVP